MAQVMTILEARVAQERWSDLERIFANLGAQRPAALEVGYLVQAADDPTVWRMVGLWRSREELDQYRQSVDAPSGVVLFRSVGAEPSMSIFKIKGS